MQVSNQTGLEFYKHFGFEIAETIEDYYTDIEPKACYILKKTLWRKCRRIEKIKRERERYFTIFVCRSVLKIIVFSIKNDNLFEWISSSSFSHLKIYWYLINQIDNWFTQHTTHNHYIYFILEPFLLVDFMNLLLLRSQKIIWSFLCYMYFPSSGCWIKLQECCIQFLINFNNRCLVSTSIAVIRCWKQCHELIRMGLFIPLHD